jgi:hypothetical protein
MSRSSGSPLGSITITVSPRATSWKAISDTSRVLTAPVVAITAQWPFSASNGANTSCSTGSSPWIQARPRSLAGSRRSPSSRSSQRAG